MPLTKKGLRILGSMRRQYGKEKGTQVFYSSARKGTITGVERKTRSKKYKIHPIRRNGRIVGHRGGYRKRL